MITKNIENILNFEKSSVSEKRFPIEEGTDNRKPNLKSFLSESYFDTRLKTLMPKYAVGALKSCGGCTIETKLRKSWKQQHNKSLACDLNLPEPSIWEPVRTAAEGKKIPKQIGVFTTALFYAVVVSLALFDTAQISRNSIGVDAKDITLSIFIGAFITLAAFAFYPLLVKAPSEWLAKLILNDTPNNAIYTGKDWVKKYFCPFPGAFTSKTRNLLMSFEETDGYFFVWDAVDRWMQLEDGEKPPTAILEHEPQTVLLFDYSKSGDIVFVKEVELTSLP